MNVEQIVALMRKGSAGLKVNEVLEVTGKWTSRRNGATERGSTELLSSLSFAMGLWNKQQILRWLNKERKTTGGQFSGSVSSGLVICAPVVQDSARL
jgi:hypothetical protein